MNSGRIAETCQTTELLKAWSVVPSQSARVSKDVDTQLLFGCLLLPNLTKCTEKALGKYTVILLAFLLFASARNRITKGANIKHIKPFQYHIVLCKDQLQRVTLRVTQVVPSHLPNLIGFSSLG